MNVNKKNCGGYNCVPDAVLKQLFEDNSVFYSIRV